MAIGADSRLIASPLRMKLLFCPSPSHSSVPAVHLITRISITLVRTRECVCVREGGRGVGGGGGGGVLTKINSITIHYLSHTK